MPFVSKSQLRTCYSQRGKSRTTKWDCNEFLKKTPSVCCLPEKKGTLVRSRCMRNGERIVGKIQTGSRGGRFFTITERDSKGTVCVVKVYVPRK
jgi:hypothetical protein